MSSLSVVITCLNEGSYVRQAVDSVLRQSRADLIDKIIIVDDGSQRETLDILEAALTLDPRIEVVFQAGAGVAKN